MTILLPLRPPAISQFSGYKVVEQDLDIADTQTLKWSPLDLRADSALHLATLVVSHSALLTRCNSNDTMLALYLGRETRTQLVNHLPVRKL